MRYAPDKTNTFPRPRDDVGSDSGGNGGGGKKTAAASGFFPGEISGLANDMVRTNGGSVENWKEFLNNVYSPNKPARMNFAGGGRGKGKGGGKDDSDKPGTDGSVDPRPDTQNPGHSRMAPMAMPYGVMAGIQPGMGVMSGIPMQAPQVQPQQQQHPMFNDGVLAMIRARMGGR